MQLEVAIDKDGVGDGLIKRRRNAERRVNSRARYRTDAEYRERRRRQSRESHARKRAEMRNSGNKWTTPIDDMPPASTWRCEDRNIRELGVAILFEAQVSYAAAVRAGIIVGGVIDRTRFKPGGILRSRPNTVNQDRCVGLVNLCEFVDLVTFWRCNGAARVAELFGLEIDADAVSAAVLAWTPETIPTPEREWVA